MNIFAKIRTSFSLVLGEIVHEGGVIVALTEAEFAAAEHKLELLEQDVAAMLHFSKGHALAISPALNASAALRPGLTPATETVNAGGGAPGPAETQAAPEARSGAAEPTPEPIPEPAVQAGPTAEPAA
ncbi:MAG TPA: hypothetical protein PLT25_05815 [Acidocella sp.]|nr:hypothetical protein [Acidocella sp.]